MLQVTVPSVTTQAPPLDPTIGVNPGGTRPVTTTPTALDVPRFCTVRV